LRGACPTVATAFFSPVITTRHSGLSSRTFCRRQTVMRSASEDGRPQVLPKVTRYPTAAWLARQITEAFPWASAPAYLVRDNDRAYGHVFITRVTAMDIRNRPIWIAMAKWYR